MATVKITQLGYGKPSGERHSRLIHPGEVIQWDRPIAPWMTALDDAAVAKLEHAGADPASAPAMPEIIVSARERAQATMNKRELEAEAALEAPAPPPRPVRKAAASAAPRPARAPKKAE